MTPEKIVFDDAAALTDGMAQWLVDAANDSIKARGRFTLVLSGGNTPGAVFSRLAQEPYATSMPWAHCFFFWGDERYVPLSDAQNNAGNAIKLLLDKVPVPQQHYYPIPTASGDAAADAASYEETLRNFWGADPVVPDVIMLGIGENGHTASLFPHTTVLHETGKLVAAIYVDEVKQQRITLTLPVLNAARQVVFLVSGKGKAEILDKVFHGPYQPEEYPSQLIAPADGQLLLIGDKAALAAV